MNDSTGPISGSRACQEQTLNKEVKSQDEACCPWWIKSSEDDNCFWKYVRRLSSEDGSLKEHVQSEIAELMGWSNTKTHFILKVAMEELVAALKANDAQELLSSGYEEQVTIPEIEPIPTDGFE